MPRRITLCVVVAAVAAALGCSGHEPPLVAVPGGVTPASPPPSPTETMPPPSPAVPAAHQPFVDHAITDLAKRLGVDRAAIVVVESRAVVWPDGSLGCPRPGMLYTQVQQDGLLIRLGHGGRAYAYHAGGGRMPVLCENPA